MEHKLIQGGEQFLPFARSRIKALRATGLKHASQKFEIDGVSIRVRIAGEHEYIELVGGCPPLLSGIIQRGWNVERLSDEGELIIDGLLAFYPSADYSGDRAWRLLPKQPPMSAETHGADYKKFDLPYLTPFRPGYPPLTPQAPFTRFTPVSQEAVIRPGMYSGTMRMVVQLMLGAQRPIKFDYRASCTHGILAITRNDKPTPWVIEISEKNGVLACRLDVCISKSSEKNPLGYLPMKSLLPCADGELQRLLTLGRVVQLITPASLLEHIGGKGALFDKCGWAFSYSGSEAQNTFIGDNGTDAIGATYKKSFRYKLSIIVEDGSPSGAVITLEDSGLMIGATHQSGQIAARSQVRVPDYDLQGCTTLNMSPLVVGLGQAYDSVCPVYVYYEGDVPQIVKWHNKLAVTDDTSIGLPAWSSFAPGDQSSYGKTYIDKVTIPGWRGETYQILSPAHPNPDVFVRDGVYRIKKPTLLYGWKHHCWSPPNISTGLDQVNLITTFQIDTINTEMGGDESRHTVTIPLYEREMIYHMKEKLTHGYEGDTVSQNSATHIHTEENAMFFYHKTIDPVTGAENPPYNWDFISINAGTPNSQFLEPSLGQGMSLDKYSASFVVDSPLDRFEAMPFTAQPYIPERANETVATLSVVGSAFTATQLSIVASELPSDTLGFSAADVYPYSRWFRVLPDEFGWVSRMWVARSADVVGGMFILPNKEPQYVISYQDDYVYDLKTYPAELLVPQAPKVVFVGDACGE